jgi:hypothetical protein
MPSRAKASAPARAARAAPHWSAQLTLSHALPLILLSGLWYAPILFGSSPPFTFDDLPSVVDSPNVRSLWPLDEALGAPPGSGASGRPLVALSLALNHAWGGLHPRGYPVNGEEAYLQVDFLFFPDFSPYFFCHFSMSVLAMLVGFKDYFLD